MTTFTMTITEGPNMGVYSPSPQSLTITIERHGHKSERTLRRIIAERVYGSASCESEYVGRDLASLLFILADISPVVDGVYYGV